MVTKGQRDRILRRPFPVLRRKIKGLKMDWIQTLSIIATVIATAYYCHRDLQQDIKIQSARSDRLYEMFIDLLKERNKG